MFKFDEDKYGVIYIALVFYLQPILTFVVKTLAQFCITNRCFSSAFDLAAEIIQFCLFCHFCNWQQQALVVLGICTVFQGILILLTPCFKEVKDVEEAASEDFAVGCLSTCVSAIFEGVGLALLLIPGDTPFKEKTYEVPFAFMCWLTSLVMVAMDLATSNPQNSLFSTITSNLQNSLFSTIACMVPYTAMLVGHFYGKWTFSIYIFVIIFASCCACCTLCIFVAVTMGKEEGRGAGARPVEPAAGLPAPAEAPPAPRTGPVGLGRAAERHVRGEEPGAAATELVTI